MVIAYNVFGDVLDTPDQQLERQFLIPGSGLLLDSYGSWDEHYHSQWHNFS